jgi:hypothetical protein
MYLHDFRERCEAGLKNEHELIRQGWRRVPGACWIGKMFNRNIPDPPRCDHEMLLVRGDETVFVSQPIARRAQFKSKRPRIAGLTD